MSEFTPAPMLSWREGKVPVSEQFGDVYFSKDNGLEESGYVFIEGTQLFQDARPRVVIGETGFGTGLNFLATWRVWQQLDVKPQLHFVSVEKYPLSKQQLIQALECWPDLKPLADALIAQYPDPIFEPVCRMVFEAGAVQLTILFGDALESFRRLVPAEINGQDACFGRPIVIDAWFLDGFAPAKNSEMWRPELFEAMAALSGKGTSLATFTAAGFVRRGLQDAGFVMQKRKGFGNKREMLVGEFVAGAPYSQAIEPDKAYNEKPAHRGPLPRIPHWARVNTPTPVKTVAIIGAGLAGCNTALSLARRGLKVSVFDKGAVASGASGNPQGVLYTRPSHHDDIFARFNAVALDLAHAYYQQVSDCFEPTGVVHLGFDEKHQTLNQQVLERFKDHPAIAESLDRSEIAKRFGGDVNCNGVYTQKGGSVSPPELCQALLNHPNITVNEFTNIRAFEYKNNGWVLQFEPHEDHADKSRQIEESCFDAVVFANAYAAAQFEEINGIYLNPIRGQMNSLLLKERAPLGASLCSEGYVAPARPLNNQWQLSFGATFTLKQDPEDLRTFEPRSRCTQKNLSTLAELLGQPFVDEAIKNSELSARVSYRCATRDYLPLVGPVAKHDSLIERFAKLRKNKNARIEASCPTYPHLYMNVGHGSRGLAYTPVCAEILASLICGEPPPIDDALYPHLHPARFYIRDLTRNKL